MLAYLVTANFDYSLCSDGLNFGFVPVQSALDYDVLGTNPLNLDLGAGSGITLATRLANVKASVITGYDSGDEDVTANHSHVGFRNDLVNNINRNDTNTYVSCIGVDNAVARGFLNAEIGDEELYLENCELPWTAAYQAQFDIHVNDRSPYYEYVSFPGAYKVSGIYSKEDP